MPVDISCPTIPFLCKFVYNANYFKRNLTQIATTEEIPLGRVFADLAREYIGIFNHRLEHLPIKRYYYALVVIDHYNGDLSQTTLGDELYLDKASVVRMLDYLEEAGCIKRCPNPCDRRAHILELTDKARDMIPEIVKAIELTNGICLKAFHKKNIGTFEADLNRVMENLQSEPKNKYKIHLVKNEDKDV